MYKYVGLIIDDVRTYERKRNVSFYGYFFLGFRGPGLEMSWGRYESTLSKFLESMLYMMIKIESFWQTALFIDFQRPV